MSSSWEAAMVLDFNDESFGQFFKSYGVDIHSPKYHTYGTSKAKKLRAFWDTEPDEIVGRVLSEMLDICVALDYSAGHYGDTPLMKKCREIVSSYRECHPKQVLCPAPVFLNTELDGPDIQNLPVDSEVSEFIEDRLQEAQRALM